MKWVVAPLLIFSLIGIPVLIYLLQSPEEFARQRADRDRRHEEFERIHAANEAARVQRQAEAEAIRSQRAFAFQVAHSNLGAEDLLASMRAYVRGGDVLAEFCAVSLAPLNQDGVAVVLRFAPSHSDAATEPSVHGPVGPQRWTLKADQLASVSARSPEGPAFFGVGAVGMVAAGIAAAAMSRMNGWDLELQEKNGDLYRLRVKGTPPEQALLRLQARMGGAK